MELNKLYTFEEDTIKVILSLTLYPEQQEKKCWNKLAAR